MKKTKPKPPKFHKGETVHYDGYEWTVVNPLCSYDVLSRCVGLIRDDNGNPYTVTVPEWAINNDDFEDVF